MFSRLGIILAFLALANLTSPLALIACEPQPVAATCEDSPCGDSSCNDETGPCARCGTVGVILLTAISNTGPIQCVMPLTFPVRDSALPEGFSPSIHQPPRAA